MSRRIARTISLKAILLAAALIFAVAAPVSAKPKPQGFHTSEPAMLALDASASRWASITPIISSGDTIGDFTFEGIPDGVGIRPGPKGGQIDVYVAHEQSTVAFRDARDFIDSTVSKLTLRSRGGRQRAGVLDASVAIGPEEGFLRFCSASMAGPKQGLDDYVFFTGEETSDTVDGIQRGFAVVLNTDTGDFTAVPGMGRLNHENTVLVPGGWDDLAMLTTDDTFSAPSSQLYMYMAEDQDAIFADEGSLYALRLTGANGTPVDPADPFNDANDYLDVGVGDSMQGEFIPVPREVALGDQDALEDWSNDNNVFQAIRLEDLAYDYKNPRVVYIADTGASRVNPDATTGRLSRGPSGTVGQADNGRVWKLVMNADDPTVVDSLSILADGDAVGTDVYVPFTSPDNVDTSRRSLMVQEDASDARIWQHHFSKDTWKVVAAVTDSDSESSGIVDASRWFGRGYWLVTVQGHGTNVAEDTTTEPGTLIKRESGQLLLMRIPGS